MMSRNKNKIKFLVAGLVMFLYCSAFANSLADSAAKAYSKQAYKQAVVFYEKILNEGKTSPSLYYNLGNAYFKNDQLGKAIYYYELAKKLNPTDADIKNNIRIANSKIIDKIDSKENFFAGSIRSGIYTLFNTTGWAWLSIVSIILTFLFLMSFIASGNLILKRSGFWLAAVSFIIFIFSITIGYAALHDLHKKNQAIVIGPVVQVMNTPTENGKARFSLHEGTKLTVLTTNEDWTAIQLSNGNEGWIRTKELGLF